MNRGMDHRMVARGLVHCHTDLSYDSTLDLDELCRALRKEGFAFVALTEHTRGITPEQYAEFVRRCGAQTRQGFVVIPGLEVRCGDDVEIAGLGVSRFVPDGPVDVVVSDIRGLGGYAVWVHPWKHRVTRDLPLGCDAIEVLNGKVDGTVAPKPQLLRAVQKRQPTAGRAHILFGMDLHALDEPASLWIECRVPSLSQPAILDALRKGEFVNRTRTLALRSAGDLSWLQYGHCAVLYTLYVVWNNLLRIAPNGVRSVLVAISRPLVRRVKHSRLTVSTERRSMRQRT